MRGMPSYLLQEVLVNLQLSFLRRKLLLTEDIPCLAVRTRPFEARIGNPYHGLFDVCFHKTILRTLLISPSMRM